MLDRYLRKGNDLRLFPELVSEVKNKDDGDIDVGRNECFIGPPSMDENNIATEEQKD